MQSEDAKLETFLGEDVEFKGDLAFQGLLRVDGKLQGKVRTDGTLVVGESAQLQTDIEAGTLIVHGEIMGNIIASERIELHATCRLYGNLQTPKLLVEEGAVLKGQCDVVTKD